MNNRDRKISDSKVNFEGFSISEIEKKFSSLAKELKNGGENLENIVRRSSEGSKKIPYFRGYEPQILDFLARATTNEECEEIIAYCNSKGEISNTKAKELRGRLKKGGPRAFGTKKPGFYDSKL